MATAPSCISELQVPAAPSSMAASGGNRGAGRAEGAPKHASVRKAVRMRRPLKATVVAMAVLGLASLAIALGVEGTGRAVHSRAAYADTSSTAQFFTKVTAKWKVPAITCTPEDRVMSDWVGLDGATTSTTTVEQTGTLGQCYEGTAKYWTWYEMYPATPASNLVGTTVKAGDTITATVLRSGTSYKLTIVDATTAGNNVTVTKTCTLAKCVDKSAEWVVERPAFSIGITPLAQFKTASHFSAAKATGGGKSGVISTFPDLQIEMFDAEPTSLLRTPSVLNATGHGFGATSKNSYQFRADGPREPSTRPVRITIVAPPLPPERRATIVCARKAMGARRQLRSGTSMAWTESRVFRHHRRRGGTTSRHSQTTAQGRQELPRHRPRARRRRHPRHPSSTTPRATSNATAALRRG